MARLAYGNVRAPPAVTLLQSPASPAASAVELGHCLGILIVFNYPSPSLFPPLTRDTTLGTRWRWLPVKKAAVQADLEPEWPARARCYFLLKIENQAVQPTMQASESLDFNTFEVKPNICTDRQIAFNKAICLSVSGQAT